eukprot:TRINITY_DN5876_c0_g1_i1.p1 TRINITY_DN5876_c0_g1~~TRINITY_DN5876_c0_g1_i1.p1  ORF type:complete len:202 (-),score=53.98 TRINITY_DN5876_c0_g1_i1:7-612(-)
MMEGSDRHSGSAIEWGKEVGIIESVEECAEIARSVPDANDVVFIPAFSGLNQPWHDDSAAGSFQGLNRGVKKEHLVRAILEGVSMRLCDMLTSIRTDIPIPITEPVKVDGGASLNSFVMQHTADMMDLTFRRASNTETTSLGAAFFAGLHVEFWKNLDEISGLEEETFAFNPEPMDEEQRKKKIQQWNESVRRTMHWSDRT